MDAAVTSFPQTYPIKGYAYMWLPQPAQGWLQGMQPPRARRTRATTCRQAQRRCRQDAHRRSCGRSSHKLAVSQRNFGPLPAQRSQGACAEALSRARAARGQGTLVTSRCSALYPSLGLERPGPATLRPCHEVPPARGGPRPAACSTKPPAALAVAAGRAAAAQR